MKTKPVKSLEVTDGHFDGSRLPRVEHSANTGEQCRPTTSSQDHGKSPKRPKTTATGVTKPRGSHPRRKIEQTAENRTYRLAEKIRLAFKQNSLVMKKTYEIEISAALAEFLAAMDGCLYIRRKCNVSKITLSISSGKSSKWKLTIDSADESRIDEVVEQLNKLSSYMESGGKSV
ncbi:Hypothetical protein CINCED_3A012481 [Cinara cedri]|uniref:Uncharacterized protein n=1 Tax=Cinara cedri TaxID=506608 RepID=A0A5E4NBB0_9HEMI|nr:Hypothetical protein CINCED_3A012481 [Cinara cedri]